MKKLLFASIVISCLCGCDSDDKTSEGRVLSFETEGHSYLQFELVKYQNRHINVVHNPNCECHFRNNRAIESNIFPAKKD